MKTCFLLVVLICIQGVVFGQEICDNGLDDDGDGYIDLNDETCICEWVGYSLIRNPSFEDTLCCPQSVSQVSCLENWEQASEGTSDYFHSCGILSGLSSPAPPFPIPDGEGFVGFLNGGFFNGLSKEYVGVCLLNDFIKENDDYVVELYVGFGVEQMLDFYSASSDTPFEICIYGNPSCLNLPFEGVECPLDSPTPDWILLDCREVFGEDEWVKTEVSFTAPEDIHTIAIGPNCEEAPFGENLTYYFLDQISLYEAAIAPIVTLDSGLPCLENVTLAVPELENISYQWYKDGVAIFEATSSLYTVPEGNESEGFYQVMLTDSFECFVTTPFEYSLDDGDPVAELGADTFLCKDQILILGEENFGDYFLWSTGETSSSIMINDTGLYAVTVSNECGEVYDEVLVFSDEEQIDCIFEMPNAFTPDEDGVNDTFGLLSNCCFSSYHLQIFSRWGQKIFESNQIGDRWDGTYKGKPVISDSYVWVISCEIGHGTNSVKKKLGGEVILIR